MEYRCTCVCGCETTDSEEQVKNTGCLACSHANHIMGEHRDEDDWGGGMTLSEHASLRDKS